MKKDEIIIFTGMVFKKKKNEYYCSGALGRYVDELSLKYERMYLCVPVQEVTNDEEVNDYKIKSTKIIIQELPVYKGFVGALKRKKSITNSIKLFSSEWNGVIYVRWPVPFSYTLFKIAKKRNLPICFHLVGDTKAIVSQGDKYRGLIKLLAVLYANVNELLMKKMLKKSVALVNGSGLRRLYQKNKSNRIKEIRTSTFKKDEIYYKEDRLSQENIKLLYVGYMRHEKGIPFLIDAIKDLINEGYNISLTLVGDGDKLQNYRTYAQTLGIDKNVSFKGHIPLGNELLEKYRENDIFILPSISEGTPRVLIEAMANGAIVIATNTGGIPYTIKNEFNGLLVEPKSSEALKMAILRVIEDKGLRQSLLENGYQFAEMNTLESHVDEVYQFISENCSK